MAAIALAISAFSTVCASSGGLTPEQLAARLDQQAGYRVRAGGPPGLPPGVSLEDGLTAGPPPRRRDAADRRCRGDRRRLAAADRRCGDQRRHGADADRREAARRQHPRRDARRRSGPGGAEAGDSRRRRRFTHLPPGDVHRDVAQEPRAVDVVRCCVRHRRTGRLSLRMAQRADYDSRHAALVDGGGVAADLLRPHHRHDGARRPDHRARRCRRRRDHRRGEHRAAPAAERGP
jgi:hypothetical protein